MQGGLQTDRQIDGLNDAAARREDLSVVAASISQTIRSICNLSLSANKITENVHRKGKNLSV